MKRENKTKRRGERNRVRNKEMTAGRERQIAPW